MHNLKNFGIHGSDDVENFGGNAKLDEFRSAMGICNLRRIKECFEKRSMVYQKYYDRLGGVSGINLCEKQTDVTQNYAYFPVYFDKKIFGKSRDDVFELLKEKEIYTRKYFYPAINEMSCYKNKYKNMSTPIAHDSALNILALPMYEELTLEQVDRICDLILQ